MNAENVRINDNRSSGEYVSLKKSTVKNFIVIAAAVAVGGLGAFFVNFNGCLVFSVSSYGGWFNFIASYAVYAAAAVAAVCVFLLSLLFGRVIRKLAIK